MMWNILKSNNPLVNKLRPIGLLNMKFSFGGDMPILWQDKLNVGISFVDSQHQYLVSLINTIEAAGNCSLERDLFLTHLSQLEAYTHFHFDQEEKFQLENKYPHYESNKNEHINLIKQLAEIIETIKKETGESVRQKQVGKVFDFLRDWLIDHVIGEDMKMKGAFPDKSF